jgi:hypothetical protein
MTVSARATVVAASLSAALLFSAAVKQPIRKPTYDPAVPVVELFDAIDRELVEVTVIARNSHEANLFVTNKSGAPVSVQLPQVVGAVHILKQLGPPPGNNGPGNSFGASSNGQGQPVGGGVQNNAKSGPANVNNFPGGPIFSVPSEKSIQLPLKTVCLAFGRPDPQPKMQYQLVRLEEITRDANVRRTLEHYVSGEIDEPTAQAAAWHLVDELSWKKLARMRFDRVAGLTGKLFFTAKQIEAARHVVETIRESDTDDPRTPVRGVSARTGK